MGKPEFTGERFLPECAGEIAYEHWHRYVFARHIGTGKTVLDVATGDGYGAALLSGVAAFVCGVDIDQATVKNASARYAAHKNLAFIQADGSALPFPDGAFDLVVSFETIEHVDAGVQALMLKEFERLLTPNGLLVISSPNKAVYSDATGFHNPFHVRELYRDDLSALLSPHFAAYKWFHQRLQFWSGIWDEQDQSKFFDAWSTGDGKVEPYRPHDSMYFIVVAAKEIAVLPATLPTASLLTDRDDSVLKRAEADAKKLIKQYGQIDELSNAADRQTYHIQHLETLLAEHAEATDRQTHHLQHLEGLLAEHAQTIDHQAKRVQLLEEERERNAAELNASRLEVQQRLDPLRRRIRELEMIEGSQLAKVQELTDLVRSRDTWRWWTRYPIHRSRRMWSGTSIQPKSDESPIPASLKQRPGTPERPNDL